jgi:hypothetical protein
MKARDELPELPEVVRRLAARRGSANGAAPAVSGYIVAGDRNMTLMSLAGTMRRRGFDGDAISAALAVTNQTRCKPPLDDGEVARIARSVTRYAPEDAALRRATLGGSSSSSPYIEGDDELLRSPLRVLDTRSFTESPPPSLDWLADGIWARGKLTLFGGREKRGKSLVQMAIAVFAASGGGVVAGIRVEAAKVLLIDGENGREEIHRRIRALGLKPGHADNFIVAEARGFELREHLPEVRALIEHHGPGVVLLDSFRTLWRGREREEDDVPLALDPLRQLAHDMNVATSLTHHAQKGGDEYRGSTAIGACVDWCVMLTKAHGDDDSSRRQLTNPLARFAPERPPRWLRILSGGDDGPIALAEAEVFDGGPGLVEAVKRVMLALALDGEPHSRTEAGEECEKQRVCSASTFSNVFPQLEKTGFINTESRPTGRGGREKWWTISATS